MKYKEIAQKAFQLLNQQAFQDAEFYFTKLVKKFPANLDFINALAFVKLNLKKTKDSLALLKKSVSINSKQPLIFFNISLGYIELDNCAEALKYIDMAIELDPGNSNFYFTKAKAFSGCSNYEKAEDYYLKALNIDDKFYDAYLNLGYVYNLKKDYESGIKVLEKLIILNSEFPGAHYNLAIIYDNQKNYDKAIFHYKKTIDLDQENYKAHYNLSILLLYKGFFEEGWCAFEYRWHETQKPKLFESIPECNNLNDKKNLLIWGEQGVGDQILYSSMLTDLNLKQNVTVALDKRLVSIYQNSFPKINFMGMDNLDNVDNFDSHLPIGSLGKFLRKTRKSFENQSKKFLYSDEKRKNKLKKFLTPKKKLLFGLAWKSKNENIGHFKSINLDEYIPLLKLPNIDFVNLQYGDTQDEIIQIEKKYKIKIHNIDELDKFYDLDGLFCLVDLCDYVITSSNVTAHIAGALGKKTFLIIPNIHGAAWYWHDDNFVGWYPSVRIFRQSAQGCWNLPIQNICEEIKNLNTINF